MPRASRTLKKQIYDAKVRVFKLEEAYSTQLYLATMPEYDPQYKYCYSTSNSSIPYDEQSVDAWLRAIAIHMSMRKPAHGGAYTKAVVISIPNGLTVDEAENWLAFTTKELRNRVMPRAAN